MNTDLERSIEPWPGYVLPDPQKTPPPNGPEFDQQGEWRALEQVVAPCWRSEFMFMGLFDTERRIYCYKHRATREYLNVDLLGRFYIYSNRRYQRIERSEVRRVLVPQLSQQLGLRTH